MMAIVAAIAPPLLLLGCTQAASRAPRMEEAAPQTRKEREVRPFFGSVVDTIGAMPRANESDDGKALFAPLTVVVDDEEAAYVLDRADMKIKKFDRNGRFVRSFGEGVGQGPGEFTFLADFALNGAREVVALDGRANHVTRFDSVGNVLNRIVLPRQGTGIAALADDAVALRLTGPGPMFGVFALDGQVQSLESGPISASIEDALRFVGQMKATGRSGFVFSPYYTGSLAGFDSSLRLRYHVQSIEPSPLPLVQGEGQSFSLNTEEARGSYMPVSATADSVYTIFFSRATHVGYLDVYSNVDGSYSYSAEIPELCAPVSVTESHAYLICNQTDVVKVARLATRTPASMEAP